MGSPGPISGHPKLPVAPPQPPPPHPMGRFGAVLAGMDAEKSVTRLSSCVFALFLFGHTGLGHAGVLSSLIRTACSTLEEEVFLSCVKGNLQFVDTQFCNSISGLVPQVSNMHPSDHMLRHVPGCPHQIDFTLLCTQESCGQAAKGPKEKNPQRASKKRFAENFFSHLE